MTIFREIEKRLENLVEGFFNNRFHSSLQPIELARKLAAEMDRKRQISVAHTYAPNAFTVAVAPPDLVEFEGFEQSIVTELADYLTAYAQDKKYRLPGAIQITLTDDQGLRSGDCRVFSHLEESRSAAEVAGHTQVIPTEEIRSLVEASPKARLENLDLGLAFDLDADSLSIGRSADNDVVLTDSGISRHHARLEREKNTYLLTDLGSTNGTFVNDREISQVTLADRDRITFGALNLTFRSKL